MDRILGDFTDSHRTVRGGDLAEQRRAELVIEPTGAGQPLTPTSSRASDPSPSSVARAIQLHFLRSVLCHRGLPHPGIGLKAPATRANLASGQHPPTFPCPDARRLLAGALPGHPPAPPARSSGQGSDTPPAGPCALVFHGLMMPARPGREWRVDW